MAVVLKCVKCGKRLRLTGDLDLIYKKVVAADWGGCDDLCPACTPGDSELTADPD